ncbi:MAG: phenylalanine--tRNA ligase subunit alpha, partial [Candidatus Absconditabacteria bacterium]
DGRVEGVQDVQHLAHGQAVEFDMELIINIGYLFGENKMISKEQILDEISKCDNESSLSDLYQKYLGKKGIISEEFKLLKDLSVEEKKEKGQLLSDLKTAVDEAYQKKNKELNIMKINKALEGEIIDHSTYGKELEYGHHNLITKVRREMEEIFKGLGFMIEYGSDVVTKYENFYSLNIPATHPATEMHDTFYMKNKDTNGENYVLRTHTSTMQNILLKKYGAPLRVIVPGKVYRYENTDASHDTVFWQLEGLMVGKDISIANFKDLMQKVLQEMFMTQVTLRMRPAFFPFVEPGFEIDVSCPICKGTGCSLCKNTGWIEILGAGMIHENVLTQAGLDPNEVSGFAFGMGLTRLVAIKYGINDVRLFTNGDLRFIKSFE